MNGRVWPPLLAVLGMAAANAGATDVDLAKAQPPRSAEFAWQGRTLSQVLPVEDIERLVLLKAVTSAPAALDMRNFRRMLRDAAGEPLQVPQEGERQPLQAGGPDTIWEAVLLTRDGGAFRPFRTPRRGLAVRASAPCLPHRRSRPARLLRHSGCRRCGHGHVGWVLTHQRFPPKPVPGLTCRDLPIKPAR